MRSLKGKKTRYIWKTIVLPFCMLGVMLGILFLAIFEFEQVNMEQNLLLTEQVIRKATIQCYANEGSYPSDLAYLEENYNVKIDYTRFHIKYDCKAANIMPNIQVFEKQSIEEQGGA